MKKLAGLLVLLCMQLLLQAQINDPNAQVREVAPFTGIHVSNAFNVYLSQASADAVAVSASSVKDRDLITVEVKNGILYIGMKKDSGWKGNKKLRAYISFRDISSLNISGACDVFVQGSMKVTNLKIQQSGASDFKGKLDAERLEVELSGASDMTVSGTVTRLQADVSGASDFKGYDLTAESCTVQASGASDVHISVSKELSAEVSGASDVKYKGDCSLRNIKTSGSGSIKKTS